MRVWTASIGWRTLLFWHFGTFYSVEVPACGPCGRRLRAMRVAKLAVTCVLTFAAVAVAMWVLASYRGPLKKWLAMLITLTCLLPYVLWEVVFPPAFDVTCFSETVDFEFRDPAYAAEFELLNRGGTAGDKC